MNPGIACQAPRHTRHVALSATDTSQNAGLREVENYICGAHRTHASAANHEAETLKTITTPKGKRMTVGQYLALRRAQEMRNYTGLALDCEHGHGGCACWLGGPCSDDMSPPKESDTP